MTIRPRSTLPPVCPPWFMCPQDCTVATLAGLRHCVLRLTYPRYPHMGTHPRRAARLAPGPSSELQRGTTWSSCSCPNGWLRWIHTCNGRLIGTCPVPARQRNGLCYSRAKNPATECCVYVLHVCACIACIECISLCAGITGMNMYCMYVQACHYVHVLNVCASGSTVVLSIYLLHIPVHTYT